MGVHTWGGDTQWEGEGHMTMGQEHLEGDDRLTVQPAYQAELATWLRTDRHTHRQQDFKY